METYSSIRPGKVWLDTEGKRIQAHGGSLMYWEGVFYWYGENKEKTLPGSGIWHWGVRCYSSKDLYNWKDEGIILQPVPEDPENPLHPSQCMDRPHILYNEKTKKFVMWLKIMGKDGRQFMVVALADRLLGPYVQVKRLNALNMSTGDFDLVKAEDGKAYFYFDRVHCELICADLTEDYTDVTGYYSTHFPRVRPPFVREAPAFFERRGQKYLFTSGTTGYFPNPSEIASAPCYHGPWEVLGDPHVDEPGCTSYRSQISSVFKHPQKDLYIALADRWLTDLPENLPDIMDVNDSFTNPDREPVMSEKAFQGLSAQNTSLADYVWLPVLFDGDRPYLKWMDEWRVEDF